ncbi:MAG: hypothetical protein ACLR5X_13770 [Oscillospiraceae bacterium]
MKQTTKPAACPDSVRVERIQISHGRAIRVVSVFPKNGSQTAEEKLRVLAALELQRKKVGIRARMYLKTPNAPGQRAFLRCAASFFLEIRQYSCEKNVLRNAKIPRCRSHHEFSDTP